MNLIDYWYSLQDIFVSLCCRAISPSLSKYASELSANETYFYMICLPKR